MVSPWNFHLDYRYIQNFNIALFSYSVFERDTAIWINRDIKVHVLLWFVFSYFQLEEQGKIPLIYSEYYAASINWKQIVGTERSGFDAVTK